MSELIPIVGPVDEPAVIEGGAVDVGDVVVHRASGRRFTVSEIKQGRGSVFLKVKGQPAWFAGGELKKG